MAASEPAAGAGPAAEWFAKDEFWTNYAPLMFDASRWAEIPAIVDGLIRLSGCQAPAAVLDSCCGPGRHGLELARRGYRVCGVDITAAYLAAFADSATAESLTVELVQADARHFQRPAAFELALNLFTSFGYFASPAEDQAYLGQLCASLKPGGHLVMDMVGKETAVRDFSEGEWFERDGKLILTEFSVVGAWEGLRNRWIIIDGANKIDHAWVQRLYSAFELRAALQGAGFKQVTIYGSWDGAAYDQQADSLIAVAEK